MCQNIWKAQNRKESSHFSKILDSALLQLNGNLYLGSSEHKIHLSSDNQLEDMQRKRLYTQLRLFSTLSFVNILFSEQKGGNKCNNKLIVVIGPTQMYEYDQLHCFVITLQSRLCALWNYYKSAFSINGTWTFFYRAIKFP